jgi:hypothetical protein
MRQVLFEGRVHTVYKDRPLDYLVVELKENSKFDVFPNGKFSCTKDGCYVQSEGKSVKLS